MKIEIYKEGSIFTSDSELIKKACEKVNKQLKDSNIIGDNIWELFTKELGFDPSKINEKEFGGS